MPDLKAAIARFGKQLSKTNSLAGAALRHVTDEVGNEATPKMPLGALVPCVR